MDKIFIKQLKIPVSIGITPAERANKQDIIIDAEIAADASKAAAKDDIQHALDYALVCKHMRDFVSRSAYLLVETLAEQVAYSVLQHFASSWIRLSLTKKPHDLPDVAGVGVIIERTSCF